MGGATQEISVLNEFTPSVIMKSWGSERLLINQNPGIGAGSLPVSVLGNTYAFRMFRASGSSPKTQELEKTI